jgi:hypothetical protein
MSLVCFLHARHYVGKAIKHVILSIDHFEPKHTFMAAQTFDSKIVWAIEYSTIINLQFQVLDRQWYRFLAPYLRLPLNKSP